MQPTPQQISSWLETVNTFDGIEKANLMQVSHIVEELANLAFAAGATTGVNSCLDYLLKAKSEWCDSTVDIIDELVDELRDAMLPKPPSLKQQAFAALDTYVYGDPNPQDKQRTYNTLRRAIESIPGD